MDSLPEELRSFTVTRHMEGPDYTEHHLTRPGWKEEVVFRNFAPCLPQGNGQGEKFRAKISSWSRLGMHPHIQTCYGFLPGHDTAFFLEKTEGESLDHLIGAGNLSLRSILSLAMQICHGAEYLHTHKIHHIPLAPKDIAVSPASLAKICNLVHSGSLRKNRDCRFSVKTDIFAFGSLVWKMARDGGQSGANRENRGKLLGPFLAKCASPEGTGDFSVLRRELNDLYRMIFAVDCPYCEIDLHLQAHYLNNLAVLHLETGRFREGFALLNKALRLQDRLSESIYNLIACKLRSNMFPPAAILSMIEAASVDSSVAEHLDGLKKIAEEIQQKGMERKLRPPPFLLCPALRSLAFYRREKQKKRVKTVIENHLKNLRYESCLKSLLSAWKKEKFQKNLFFSSIFERLLARSDTLDITGVQRYAVLKENNLPVRHLCYLPGTKKIAVNFDGKSLCILNYGAGPRSITLQADDRRLTALTVSPDGLIIAAATDCGVILFWQARSGRKILEEKSHEGKINAVDFSHDSRFFASGGVDGRLITRAVATGNKKIVTPWEDQSVETLAFVPGLLDLVVGSHDGQVKIMASRGKKCLHTIRAHNQPVTSLTLAPRGDFFATCAGEIKIWDRHSGECLENSGEEGAGATRVLLLDDNRHLVSAGMDDIIRIRDLVTGDVVAVLDGRGTGISCLAKGSQPHFFFAGRQGGGLLIWKLFYNLFFG